jgi:hypothetical protein
VTQPWPCPRADAGDLHPAQRALALEWITRGRTAAGHDNKNFYSAIFVVRDGRIQAVREYTDTLHASNVLFVLSGQPGMMRRRRKSSNTPANIASLSTCSWNPSRRSFEPSAKTS